MTISNEKITEQLQATGEVDFVRVEGDGYHYHLTVVADVFEGKSKVQRQQWVYALLKEHITQGSLHALTMKTLTKLEWENTQNG